jgi:RND family efflux transporter MFP subunit
VDELFRLGLTNAAWATVLLVAATVATRLLRSRPAVVHVLWLLVLIKLVTPSLTRVGIVPARAFSGFSPAGAAASDHPDFGAEFPSPSPRGSGERVPEGRVRGLGQSATEDERLANSLSANQKQAFNEPGRSAARSATGNEEARTEPRPPVQERTVDAARSPRVEVASPPWSWRLALLLLWLAGVAAWCLFLARTSLRFRRLVRSASPAPSELAGRASELARRLGLRQVPTIGLVPACVPPMLWSSITGPARLILPEELWRRFDPTQQDAVLAHELAHLKRRDHWVRRLEAVVLGLYWWYPGAWWARRQLERAEEECCDAWVVWALPSAAGSYADALVATAVFLSGLRQPLPLGASGAGRTRPLKRRLAMILCDRTAGPAARTVPLVVLALGLLALPFLPALVSGQQANSQGTAAPAPALSAEQPAKVIPSPAKTDEKSAQQGGAFKLVALDPTKPDKQTRVSQPVLREISDYVEVSGRLEAAHTVQLRPRVSGMIVKVRCRPGEIVKLDDPLFEIDARSYRAELDKAEAEVRRVEARLKRITLELGYKKKLRNDKVISHQEVELAETEFAEAEASLRAAKADRDLANLKLEATEVRAPVAGTVTGPVLDAGSVVTTGITPLATIVALDPMVVVFNLDEADALRFKSESKKLAPNASAPLVTLGLNREAISARTAQVNLTDLQVTGTEGVQCRASLANHDGILFPGLSATLRVTTSTPHKAILVPETAVSSCDQNGFADLKVVNEKNQVEVRHVRVGLLHDGLRVVMSGLSRDEWVIAEVSPRQTGLQ